MSGTGLSGIAGFCLALAAGAAFYLASKQQQLLLVRPPFRVCMMAGGLFAVLSLIGFVTATDRLVGVFMTVAMLMLVLSLLPLGVALHAKKGERS